MAQNSYPSYIRIGRMQYNAPDMMAFAQTKMLPSFAAIGTFENTRTGIRRAAGIDLAGAHPNGVACPVHGNITDGHRHFLIEKGRERMPVVDRFPKAARSISYIKMRRVGWRHINVRYTATHNGRADAAQFDTIQKRSLLKCFALCKTTNPRFCQRVRRLNQLCLPRLNQQQEEQKEY